MDVELESAHKRIDEVVAAMESLRLFLAHIYPGGEGHPYLVSAQRGLKAARRKEPTRGKGVMPLSADEMMKRQGEGQ